MKVTNQMASSVAVGSPCALARKDVLVLVVSIVFFCELMEGVTQLGLLVLGINVLGLKYLLFCLESDTRQNTYILGVESSQLYSHPTPTMLWLKDFGHVLP